MPRTLDIDAGLVKEKPDAFGEADRCGKPGRCTVVRSRRMAWLQQNNKDARQDSRMPIISTPFSTNRREKKQ